MKTRAFIGDIHGCYEEFEELLNALSHHSIDEVWLVGDLVDRGPDSGAVVQIAMERNIPSVLGNHENGILNLWESHIKTGNIPKKSDKARTIASLTQAHIDYIKTFPILRVFDDMETPTVLVHGGLWPNMPLYRQPHNVCRAQLIQPYLPEGETRWWGPEATSHKCKKTEEESYNEGYRRWYEVYDGQEDVVYGHSVFTQPLIHRNKAAGRTIGIDTGNVFGGLLTAVVIGPGKFYFVAIPPKKVYCQDKLGKFIVR